MQKFYLIPVERRDNARGPMYFKWGVSEQNPDPPGINCHWAMMDYGLTDTALLVAKDITQTDHDGLILNSDVFVFPDNLDEPVNDPMVDAFFEGVNIPTDWLTPSTSWLELLRQMAGMFVFNQRYNGISGGASLFDNATLDTRLRELTDQEQVWFMAVVDSFGFDSSQISTNSRLRQLVKQAGSYWEDLPFFIGGVEF